MRFLSVLIVALFAIVSTASTAVADDDIAPEAAECDCPDNYICEASVIEYCDLAEPAMCPPDDDDCEEQDESESNCYEETITHCVPPSCNSDSDCAGDTLCVEYVYEQCSGASPGCAANGEEPVIGVEPAEPDDNADDGDSGGTGGDSGEGDDFEDCEIEPVEEECEVTTERYCVPPYQAPCHEDSDCGDGFNCEFRTYGDCPVTSDDEDPIEGCEVDDESDEPGYCVLERESCEVDTDCDHDFVCHTRDVPVTSNNGVVTEPVDCVVEPDDETDEDDGVSSDGDSGDGDADSGDGDTANQDANDAEPTDGCPMPEPEEEYETETEVEGYCAPEDFNAAPTSGGESSYDSEPSSTGEARDDSDVLTPESPSSDDDGELVDSFHVGEEDNDEDTQDDADPQQDGEESGTCTTVGGSGSVPPFLVIALLAGTIAIRRRI